MGEVIVISSMVFIAAVLMQSIWIRAMRRMSLGDAIKSYGPSGHEAKIGTPGMGGVVALVLLPLTVAIVSISGICDAREMMMIWVYPLAAAAVGLADDVLKKIHRSSEGLRSIQKLCLQIVISLPWAVFAAIDGIYLTPNIMMPSILGGPLLIFLSVGFMNAVNVTDGLDGLAGGSVAISLAVFLVLVGDGSSVFSAAIAMAAISAFLWHNSAPAELFMGDVGAHLWAGILLSLCVAAHTVILIFPLGFLFGIEMITVSIQIFSIRKLGRKVFLMSPIHHHFELKGWKETKIVARFWLIHAFGMTGLLLILSLGGIINV